MTGIQVGMALMAALAIWLRGRGGDGRLEPAVLHLALFAAGLGLLLALDGSRFEPWQVVLLPPLPLLLAQHLRALAGVARWRMVDLVLAASGALCLPFLVMPEAARDRLAAGALPDLPLAWLLAALAGVGAWWLALILGLVVSGLAMARALRHHRAALAQIIAAPPTRRLDGVAVLGGFLVTVLAVQLLDLLSMGRVLVGVLSDLFLLALILGTALHGLTLRTSWPAWAEEVIAGTAAAFSQDLPSQDPGPPSYARSALTPEAMTQLLARIDATMSRESLWRQPGLSLADLAGAVPAKPFYISQALNQGRGESFYDYVNRWRVTEAQALLRSGQDSVLDIAHATGFNAKSTFNAAFVKIAGMTPSAWRAQGSAPPAPVAGDAQP